MPVLLFCERHEQGHVFHLLASNRAAPTDHVLCGRIDVDLLEHLVANPAQELRALCLPVLRVPLARLPPFHIDVEGALLAAAVFLEVSDAPAQLHVHMFPCGAMTARGRCGQCFRGPHCHRAVLVGEVDRVRLLVQLRVKSWFVDKRAIAQGLVDVHRI